MVDSTTTKTLEGATHSSVSTWSQNDSLSGVRAEAGTNPEGAGTSPVELHFDSTSGPKIGRWIGSPEQAAVQAARAQLRVALRIGEFFAAADSAVAQICRIVSIAYDSLADPADAGAGVVDHVRVAEEAAAHLHRRDELSEQARGLAAVIRASLRRARHALEVDPTAPPPDPLELAEAEHRELWRLEASSRRVPTVSEARAAIVQEADHWSHPDPGDVCSCEPSGRHRTEHAAVLCEFHSQSVVQASRAAS